MDFDAKLSSQIPFFLQDNNYSSKSRDDPFSLDGTFSSKGSTNNNNNNFIQEFHPFEGLNLNASPSNNNHPIYSLQTGCFYPFEDNNNNNSVSNSLSYNLDFYETKPYGSHAPSNHGALAPLMDYNLSHQGGGGGGLGYSHQMMVTPINMVSPSGHANYHPISYRDFGLLKSCKAPDEGSCSSPQTDINLVAKSLSETLVRKGGRGRKKNTNVVKGQWTIEEDRLLIQLVERYGIRKWSQIAQMLNGRIGKQCRERWHNHLRPDIKKDVWSEEEDMILIKAHAEIGNKWAEIAKKLPGRTENSIKNHWNATKRRQLSTRKCRSKYPRQSSLLQDYIKSLAPETINAGCRKKKPPSSSSTKNNTTTNNNPNNPNYNTNVVIGEEKKNNGFKNKVSSIDLIGSSDSSSSYRLEPEFEFSDVPDFNFDAQMFEESSIDSLLDCVPNNEEGGVVVGCDCNDATPYYDDVDDDDDEDEEEFHGKKELDLVEMINQVNL